MNTNNVIIFGTGEIAQVAYMYLTHDSIYTVKAFTVDKEFMDTDELFNLPVVPFEEVEFLYPPNNYNMFVPMSYKGRNKLRAKKYYQSKDKGYIFITYVSSKVSTFPGFVTGDNCFILEDNVIQPFTTIGNNVIMWSGNHIGHHTKIGNHCFIASHVVISGHVKVEDNCTFGVNSTVRDNINIGSGCIIGAGALILHDTEEREIYIGNETKPLKISEVK